MPGQSFNYRVCPLRDSESQVYPSNDETGIVWGSKLSSHDGLVLQTDPPGVDVKHWDIRCKERNGSPGHICVTPSFRCDRISLISEAFHAFPAEFGAHQPGLQTSLLASNLFF